MRTTDTWKYKHHYIKTPTVTPVDRIIKATKNLATAIQCHNDAPQDELESIEHLRDIIIGNSAPISHQATKQKFEPPVQRHLEPEHISGLTAPFGDFEPPTLVPQPIPVNNNAHAPEILPQNDDEEIHLQHRYNLRPRPKLVHVFMSPVHRQPPRLHPSLTSTTIPPNITHLRSCVTISNYDIDPAIIPSINVKIPQPKYAQGYGTANHALQLWQLQTTMHANLSNEGFSGAIIDNENGKSLEFCHLIKMDKYRDIWMKKFPMNLVAWHKSSVMCRAPTPLTAFPILMFHF